MLLCFFFFKQKTAYEMRISDWSSDVCSSDLRRGGGAVARRQRLADLPAGHAAEREMGAALRRAAVQRPGDGRVRRGVGGLGPRARQIGRASWRERVCQYV